MHLNQYDIREYRPQYKSGVIAVLRFLWGKDTENHEDYFKWKYEDNPFSEHPLGIVALYKNDVIGFRGFFESRWEIPAKNHGFTILGPGDTCIHPDHRRKGLSLAMLKVAAENFSPRYNIFLNLSTTKPSAPGYLKAGFYPMTKKTRLSQWKFPGLAKFLLFRKYRSDIPLHRIRLGNFEDIKVTQSALPKEMARLRAAYPPRGEMIQPVQDETFYKWRFNDKRHQYVFYYRMVDDAPTAFVVIRLTENKRRGNIVDFSESDTDSCEKILRFVIKQKHFDVLTIYKYSINQNMDIMLNKLGFTGNNLLTRLEKKMVGELPVLVRPVNSPPQESDWTYEDLDIRDINNWQIKEILSDGV